MNAWLDGLDGSAGGRRQMFGSHTLHDWFQRKLFEQSQTRHTNNALTFSLRNFQISFFSLSISFWLFTFTKGSGSYVHFRPCPRYHPPTQSTTLFVESVLSLRPLAAQPAHVCVIAERLDCLRWQAHAPRHVTCLRRLHV